MSNEATPAMILPFPIGDGVVELIDLSYYSNLFQDLEDIFPTVVNLMRSRNKSKKRSLLPLTSFLFVFFQFKFFINNII